MDPSRLVPLLTLAGLFGMMLAMGLQVPFADVLASLRSPRLVIAGLIANFVLVPAVNIGLLYLFHANPLVSVGFLILAVCPGAPVGPPFAAMARGDVPCAIGQMVILAGLSALLSPALLSLLMGQLLPAGELHIDYLAIVKSLVVAQLLPLGLGLAVHNRAPEFSRRIANPLRLAANVVLLAAIGLLVAREFHTLELIRLRGWFGMLLLLGASLEIGWLCGGPAQGTRKTLALTTAARNAAVALVIVSANFAETPAVTAVIAYALVSILGSLGAALLFGAMLPPHKQLSPGMRLPRLRQNRVG